jgi:transcriptional regulator GlxA family with amidase domain
VRQQFRADSQSWRRIDPQGSALAASTGATDVSLTSMAERAGLEERTFLRRFRAATGLKPTEYCQHLRVGKAREMLEFTNSTIDHIAWTVGYQDPGAFRATSRKSPGWRQ